MKLIVPISYLGATSEERKAVCNGCGTKGIGGFLVPDTMWGLRVTHICNIHDWMYKEAKNKRARLIADLVFLLNLMILIWTMSSKWLVVPRSFRAFGYFLVVRLGGRKAVTLVKGSPAPKPFKELVFQLVGE